MHDHSPLPTKILAVILGASLALLSPGLDFYNVWAADIVETPVVEGTAGPAAPIAQNPAAAAVGAAGAPGVSLSVAPPQGVQTALPGISAGAAGQALDSQAAAPDARPAAILDSESQDAPAALQSVAAPVQDVDHAMNRSGGANLAAARAALGQLFENTEQAGPSDNGVAAPDSRDDGDSSGRVGLPMSHVPARGALSQNVPAPAPDASGLPSRTPEYADPAEAYPLALEKASQMAASYGYAAKDLAFARAIAVEEPQGPAWAFEFHMPSAGGVYVTYRVIVRGSEASSLDWMPKFPEVGGLAAVTKPLSPYAVSAGIKRMSPEAALRVMQRSIPGIERVPLALTLVKNARTGDEEFAYSFVTPHGFIETVDSATGDVQVSDNAPAPSKPSAFWRFKDNLGMFGISLMLTGALIGIPVSVGLLGAYGLAYAMGWTLPVAMLAVGAGCAVILAAAYLHGPWETVPNSFEDRHPDLFSYAMLTLLFSAATGLIGGGAAWLFTHAAAHLAAGATTGGATALGLASLAPKGAPTPGQPQKPWIERNWKLVAGIGAAVIVLALAAWFFAHVSVSVAPAAIGAAGIGWFGLSLRGHDDAVSALSNLQPSKVDEIAAFRHALHALNARVAEQLSDGKSVRDLAGDVIQEVMDLKKFFDVKPEDPAAQQAVADVQSFLGDFARQAAKLSRETDDPALYQEQVRDLLGAAEYAAATSENREELLARLSSALSSRNVALSAAALSLGGAAKAPVKTRADRAEALTRWADVLILGGAGAFTLAIMAYLPVAFIGQAFLGYNAYDVESAYAVVLIWTLLGALASSAAGTALAALAMLFQRKK